MELLVQISAELRHGQPGWKETLKQGEIIRVVSSSCSICSPRADQGLIPLEVEELSQLHRGARGSRGMQKSFQEQLLAVYFMP